MPIGERVTSAAARFGLIGVMALGAGAAARADAIELWPRDEGPVSPRLGVAAALTRVGRHEEAVEELRRAFVETQGKLRPQDVAADPRFAALASLESYRSLLDEVRVQQAGPLDRLLLRLERVEAAANEAKAMLDRIATLARLVGRLAQVAGTATVALIFLGLFVTFGVNQLGLLQPPWTLGVGMGVASVLWHAGTRVVSGGESWGLRTIATAWLVLATPWLVAFAIRWLRRRAG